MSIHPKKHSQFELFPARHSDGESGEGQSGQILKDLTLSPEHIIVLGIIFLMTAVLLFSFGVERGKNLTEVGGRLAVAEKRGQSRQLMAKTIVQSASAQAIGKRLAHSGNDESLDSQTVDPNLEKKMGPLSSVVEIPIAKVTEKSAIIESGFTLQVASFKSKRYAEEEAGKLKAKAYDAYILPKGDYYIVCIGKFSRREDAKKYIAELKGKYKDSLVRRL